MSAQPHSSRAGPVQTQVPSTATHPLSYTTTRVHEVGTVSEMRIPAWHRASLRLCCDHLSMTTKEKRRGSNERPRSTTATATSPTTTPAEGTTSVGSGSNIAPATSVTHTPDAHRNEDEVPLLSDVSAMFVGGRLSGVINCCGTDSAYDLLSALAGWDLPGTTTITQGDIVLNGTPVTAPSYQARAVFLDDDFAPLENLTVCENLTYARSLRVARHAYAYTVDEVLAELALTSVRDILLRECGVYTRRRVMLGKELLLNPMVLLLDHPLRGLATHEARQFLTLLRRLASPASTNRVDPSHSATARRPALSDACAATPPLPLTRSTSAADSAITHSTTTTAIPSLSARPSTAATTDEQENLTVPAETAPSTPRSAAAPPLPSIRQERVVVLSMVQPRWVLLQLLDDITLLVRDKVVYCGPLEGLYRAPLLDTRPPTLAHSASSVSVARTTAPSERNTKDASPLMDASSTSTVVRQSSSATFSSALVNRERRRELFFQQLYQAASASAFDIADTATPAATTHADVARADHVSDDDDAQPSPHPTEADLLALMAGTGNTAALRVEVDRFLSACAAGTQTLEGWRHVPPSGAQQFMYLCVYELVQLRHGIVMRLAALVLVALLSVLLGWLYSKQGGQTGMQTRVGILFFLVSSTFLNTLMSTRAVQREYARFQRHRAQGYYSALTYVSHRYVADVVLRFAIGTCVALLVFVCTNFGGAWSDASVFELMVVLVLTSLCGSMTALLTCSACALLPCVHASVDQFVLLAVYTGNLLFAGLVLNLTSMPAVVQALSFTSVCRLAFESCVLTQFRGRTFDCIRPESDDNTSMSSTNLVGLSRVVMDAMSAVLTGTEDVSFAQSSHALGSNAVQSASSSFSSDISSSSSGSSSAGIACHTGDSFAAFLGFEPARRWVDVLGLAAFSLVLFVCSLITMGTSRSYRHRKRTHP